MHKVLEGRKRRDAGGDRRRVKSSVNTRRKLRRVRQQRNGPRVVKLGTLTFDRIGFSFIFLVIFVIFSFILFVIFVICRFALFVIFRFILFAIFRFINPKEIEQSHGMLA